jgi:site-specific recombinase XerC
LRRELWFSKQHLVCRATPFQPASVNLMLAALDHLYLFLGLGRPKVRREDLPQEAPRALQPEAQKRFLRAVERCTSVRDRALALLLFYTALRIGECASLDTDDVALSARKGKVTVRAGKGDTYRKVALNAEAREALAAWLTERRQRFPKPDESALFLNAGGRRLSIRSAGKGNEVDRVPSDLIDSQLFYSPFCRNILAGET